MSQLYHDGIIKAVSYTQNQVFEAAVTFARNEGIVPDPESAHAVKGAIEEALAAKESGEERTILFALSGHGYFDFSSYDAYLGGKLEDIEYSSDLIQQSLNKLPKIK